MPSPLDPFPRCVWKLVGEQQSTDMDWFILLYLQTILLFVLFLDTELQQRNAECFLTVAMTMTSGDHPLPLPLKFILVPICRSLDFTISRVVEKKLKYMARTTRKPKEKPPTFVSLRMWGRGKELFLISDNMGPHEAENWVMLFFFFIREHNIIEKSHLLTIVGDPLIKLSYFIILLQAVCRPVHSQQ